jgi:hypothetical protein
LFSEYGFSDHNLWNQIVLVWATLEILGCSNLQTPGAMFLCPEIHWEVYLLLDMADPLKSNNQTEFEIVDFPEGIC